MKSSVLSRRLFAVFLLLPGTLLFAAAPLAEVHEKCLQNSREVYQARLMDCKTSGRNVTRCRAEAAKEKRELLDYCAVGLKKQPATIIVNSH
jgi:hypothetical protein